MKLYLTARSTNEHNDYASRVVVVTIDAKFLRRVRSLAHAARKVAAAEIQVMEYRCDFNKGFCEETGEPQVYGEGDDALRTEIDRLCVVPQTYFPRKPNKWDSPAFYFQAYFKNGNDDRLETEWVYLRDLPLTPPWKIKK